MQESLKWPTVCEECSPGFETTCYAFIVFVTVAAAAAAAAPAAAAAAAAAFHRNAIPIPWEFLICCTAPATAFFVPNLQNPTNGVFIKKSSEKEKCYGYHR